MISSCRLLWTKISKSLQIMKQNRNLLVVKVIFFNFKNHCNLISVIKGHIVDCLTSKRKIDESVRVQEGFSQTSKY